MHKLRKFWGCDFFKIRPFFGVFSRISPLGSAPKMTIRNSGLLPSFSRISSKKEGHFSQKTLFWEKADRPYQKKARIICCKFLHFWKIGGFFQILNSWSSHITGRFWKIREKFRFVIFWQKIVMGRKRRNSLFSKNAIFRKNAFCDFLLGRAYAKMKK
jgi:hypothetical protein